MIDYHQKFVEGQCYHIYNRTIDEVVLFREEEDYKDFLIKFQKYFHPYLDIYAYCLIPNHFHFLVKVKCLSQMIDKLKSERSISARSLLAHDIPINDFLEDQMRRFFSAVSLRYNFKYRRKGAVFSDRLKRIHVKNETKLIYLCIYIHHNPVHHKLIGDYEEWTYSSYNAYGSSQNDIVEVRQIIKLLGGLEIFRDYHHAFKVDMDERLNLD